MVLYNTPTTVKIKILRIKYTITTSKNYKSNACLKSLKISLKNCL